MLAENDPEITALLKPVHEATRKFVSQPIGKATDNMYSFLALVQDDPTIQIVNQAQKHTLKSGTKCGRNGWFAYFKCRCSI